MKNCALIRAQPLRIFLFVLVAIAGIIAGAILIYDIAEIIGWLFFFFACVALFLERTARRSCELICLKDECRAGEHVIRNCSGKCHHWCDTREDPDLAPEEEEVKDDPEYCGDCVFTHSVFGSENSVLGCSCICHGDKKKNEKPRFRCSCHIWCWGKK